MSRLILFPKQRLRGGVLTLYVHKLVGNAGFPGAGRRVLAVAGGFGRRAPWLWLAASGAGRRLWLWLKRSGADVVSHGYGWNVVFYILWGPVVHAFIMPYANVCMTCIVHVCLSLLAWLPACIVALPPHDDA